MEASRPIHRPQTKTRSDTEVGIHFYLLHGASSWQFVPFLSLPPNGAYPTIWNQAIVCFTISWTFFHIFHIFIFCLWCLFLPFYISFSLWIPEEGFPSYSISRLSQYPIGHKICLQVLLKCNLSSSLQELDIVNCAMYSI